MTFDEEMEAQVKELVELEAKAHEMRNMARAIATDIKEAETYAAECRHRLREALESVGVLSMRVGDYSIAVAHGGPAVVIVNEAELPADYVKIKREPDKIKIGSALEEGKPVPGAMLSNAMPTLQVRSV